ncbi:hypothetical protein [Acinetobacter baumannii]|uniref:hypothetical protein n=1 Tax=Acinetobacter baumannii TaxID=470 RepID=UPI0005713D8A
MAQESRLVIVIDSQNAERNARNLGNELDSIERKGEFASKSMDSLSVATRALAGAMAAYLLQQLLTYSMMARSTSHPMV